jgi:hypothetical protein
MVPPFLQRVVEEDLLLDAKTSRQVSRVENRIAMLEQVVLQVQQLLLGMNEVIRMSIDPNVQKIVDDEAAMKAAVEAMVGKLGDVSNQVADLNKKIADMTANGTMSAENAAALQAVASDMEATIAQAQAAVAPPAAAPADVPSPDAGATPAAQ